MQRYFFRFLLIGWYLLSACTRFSNRIDPLAIQCGPHASALSKAVLDVNGQRIPGSDLEAFVLQSGQRQDLAISEKGCVGLPLDSSGTIVVRTHSGKPQGVSLSSQEAWDQPAIALRVVGDEDIFLNCPDATYTDGTFLNLNAFVHGTFDSKEVRIRLQDESNQDLQSEAFLQDGQWLVKLPTLAHGMHALTLQAENLLNAFKKPVSSTCKINVDLTTPSVSIPYDPDYALDPRNLVWRRNPGQSIQITSDDDGFPQETFYCLQEKFKPDEEPTCAAPDFLPWSVTFSAPEKGLWQLEVFARDAAGHQSPTKKSNFLVYREAEMQTIRALLASAESDIRSNEQIKAGRKILKADLERHRLSAWEAADLEYPVLQASLQLLPVLKQKAILRDADPLAESQNRMIAYSQDAEKLLVGGDKIEILDRAGKRLAELQEPPTNFQELGFAENDSTIWVTSNNEVRFYNVDGSYRCSLESRYGVQMNFSVQPSPLYVGIVSGWPREDYDATIYDSHCEPVDSFSLDELPNPGRRPMFSFFFSADHTRFGVYQFDWFVRGARITVRDLKKAIVRTITVDDPILVDSLSRAATSGGASSLANFTRDANTLAICDSDGIAHFYDLLNSDNDKQLAPWFKASSPIQACLFNRAEDFIQLRENEWIIMRKNSAGSYDTYAGIAPIKMNSPTLAIDPSRRYFVEYGSIGGNQGRMVLYSLDSFAKLKTQDYPSIEGRDYIAINPKKDLEITLSRLDREISLWSFQDESIEKKSLGTKSIDAKTYDSPDHSFYILQEKTNELLLWPRGATTPKVLAIPDDSPEDSRYGPTIVAISPDSRFVAARIKNGSFAGVQIWDREGQALPFVPLTAMGFTNSMKFSLDGQFLALATYDGELAFLHVGDKSAQEAKFLPNMNSILIATQNDGFYLASVNNLPQKTWTDCQINRIDDHMQAHLISSDICYTLGDFVNFQNFYGDFYDSAKQNVFARTLSGEFVSLNLATLERRHLTAPNEPSGFTQQRNGILVTKNLSKNRLSIVRDGFPTQDIDLGFRYTDTEVLLDSRQGIWAYNTRGAIEYRQLNGQRLLSLPYAAVSVTPVDDYKKLVMVVVNPGEPLDRWVLPLRSEDAIAKLGAWGF